MNMQQAVQDHMTGLMKYTGDEYQNQSASAVRRYGGGGGGASRMPQMPNFQQWNQQRKPMQFASAFQTLPFTQSQVPPTIARPNEPQNFFDAFSSFSGNYSGGL